MQQQKPSDATLSSDNIDPYATPIRRREQTERPPTITPGSPTSSPSQPCICQNIKTYFIIFVVILIIIVVLWWLSASPSSSSTFQQHSGTTVPLWDIENI